MAVTVSAAAHLQGFNHHGRHDVRAGSHADILLAALDNESSGQKQYGREPEDVAQGPAHGTPR
jgi:hypothetical protein